MSTADDHMLADLRLQAEAMTGPASLPRAGGDEPVFDEPWQGRAVAIAIQTVAHLGVSWQDFRARLIARIAEDPHRDYYDSWVAALEDLVAAHELAEEHDLTAQRLTAASYRTDEQGHGDLEVFPVRVDETTALDILTTIFTEHWAQVRFGPLIQGAVYELGLDGPPALSMLDGYLTIDLGGPHVHLCVGEHRGTDGRPVDPDLARRRRCAHVELQRQWVDDAPQAWMVRLFNGDGDQMITVLLPSPFLSDDMQLLDTPDWSRLSIWDDLRARYLGLPPDPADRLADGFVHG